MDRNICGEFPEFGYRAFTEERQAKQFVNEGAFRMGCQLTYRMAEGVRGDRTEGEGHIQEPHLLTIDWGPPRPGEPSTITREMGYMERHVSHTCPKFCFCTSLPEVEIAHMKKAFGEFIVCIENPVRLAEDIHDFYAAKGVGVLVQGCKVLYNKGQQIAEKLTDFEVIDLAYKQKPARFSADCEFRFVAMRLGDPCPRECRFFDGEDTKCRFEEWQNIALGRPLEYVHFVG